MSNFNEGLYKGLSTIVRTALPFGGKAVDAMDNWAKKKAEKEIGLAGGLSQQKKLQIMKDKIRRTGDDAQDNAAAVGPEGAKKMQGARWIKPLSDAENKEVRKDVYAKSYNFGNGQTNITPDMEKEAKENNWKRGAAAK